MDSHVIRQLTALEKEAGVEPPTLDDTGAERLQYLIRRLRRTTGRQVVEVLAQMRGKMLCAAASESRAEGASAGGGVQSEEAQSGGAWANRA